MGMADVTVLLPDDLEPTNYGFLSGHCETQLAFCRWEHPSPKGRVVISHGYGEHGERYRHIAHWLHERGWSVSAMDHRGFGRSGGPRGDADGIHGFVDDLVLFLRHERRFDADRVEAKPRIVDGVPLPPLPVCPQIVLGHSFGGLVAALTLLWHADTMEGLILSSPVLALRPLPPALRILKTILKILGPHRTLNLPNDKSQICSDPIFVQRYWKDPLCHRHVSVAFEEALQQGREELIGLGHELDRPMLVMEAELDTVTDPDGSDALWSAIPPELLERHRMMGFKHEVLHDLKRGEALEKMEAWLSRFHGPHGNPDALAATQTENNVQKEMHAN